VSTQNPGTLVVVISHPRKTLLTKVKGNYMKKIHFPIPPLPPTPPYTHIKKIVYVSYTYTDIGTVVRVGDPRGGSDVWCTRLPRKWSEAAKKICEEKGWSKSELTRNALCVFIQAYMSSGVDLSEVEVKPRNTVILNYNSVENNVNVGRPPYRKYERELEEPHLKAEFRNLAEEILKGPPKEKKWDHYNYIYVEVPPPPRKWRSGALRSRTHSSHSSNAWINSRSSSHLRRRSC